MFQVDIVAAVTTFAFLQQTQKACLDIKWNNCARVLTAMYKQNVLCKFLTNINLISMKSKQMH